MKRFLMIVSALVVVLMIGGCAMIPPKQHIEVLPKTKFVVVGKVETFKDSKEGIKESRIYIKDMGEQTNDPSYVELANTYSVVFKEELKKNGFEVLDKHENQIPALIINTKLGYMSPIFLIRYGTIMAQTEVIQNGKLIFSFDEAVVVTGLPFKTLPDFATSMKRVIAPRVAKKIKECCFLE